jgi:hypothetical protein
METVKLDTSEQLVIPQTLEAYEELVDKVVSAYSLTERDYASGVISIVLRRLPNEVDTISIDQLGKSVRCSIGKTVAHHKGQLLEQKSQINVLVETLKQNPLDAQARDQLQKAADDGVQQAKDALAALELPDYTPLKAVSNESETANSAG